MTFDSTALDFLAGSGVWLVAAAAVATLLLLLALRPLLERYALARPNARSSHSKPTPQGAGIGVVAVTIVSAAAAIVFHGVGTPPGVWLIFSAVAFVGIIGVVDDIRTLDVLPRLALQAASAILVVASLPGEVRVFSSLPFLLERALLVFAAMWFMNLTNFMDGLDWMMVAEILPLTAGLCIAALIGALPLYGLVISLALAGAMLGFAPLNKPVARMFLGDVGSLPIGLLTGWLLVLLAGNGHFAAAFLLPLYFVADATLTLARRAYAGEPVWQAHRTHFYQRATNRGFTVTRVVTLVFAINCVLAALSLITIMMPTYLIAISCLIAGIALVGALLINFARGRMLRG